MCHKHRQRIYNPVNIKKKSVAQGKGGRRVGTKSMWNRKTHAKCLFIYINREYKVGSGAGDRVKIIKNYVVKFTTLACL